jgi:hypothetical protein
MNKLGGAEVSTVIPHLSWIFKCEKYFVKNEQGRHVILPLLAVAYRHHSLISRIL